MKKTGKYLSTSKRRRKKRVNYFRVGLLLVAALLILLLIGCLIAGVWRLIAKITGKTEVPPDSQQTVVQVDTTESAEEEPSEKKNKKKSRFESWETGYIATLDLEVTFYDKDGAALGVLPRGTQVEYKPQADGSTQIQIDDVKGYLQEGVAIVSDIADIIPVHTLYVKSAVNLRNAEGRLLKPLAEKGDAVEVKGYDYLEEDGTAHMYRVELDGEEGYILPWYLVDNEEEALAPFNKGLEMLHGSREDLYGGGSAENLDYYPREKDPIEGNPMPDECRTLYVVSWQLDQLDEYLRIADDSNINAFVVDINDGGAVGYASDVMKEFCPSGAAYASNTVEEYQAAIQRIKDAGYYVIGRITTFNDSYLVSDHPEYAITDNNGEPMVLSGEYWPTAFNRDVWQFKVDLAVEAVELMGFNEIQFDYVRFPDLTWDYEQEGTIDFHNEYGETKAQAIQRFLMYASDIIREHGAYVSADVFGESAYDYVTAYGQYWPAISNVVDAISGMPYPDHFSEWGDWKPWEHPYDTLYDWGESAMYRQAEIPTPAAVRTWIQTYDAIREPYNHYGPNEIAAQIEGLRDAGCTGGYITWNAESDLEKYREVLLAF